MQNLEPTLELREVCKSFGDVQAVDRVSLRVRPGIIFGFLGPNGAGKTTTIRMIMDIIAPDGGEILLNGRRRRPEDLDRIGYLPEERGLYRKLTAEEHLVFLARLHGMRRKAALPAIGSWLERLGLEQWADRKVEELSKGMQQKIQLIGTLLHEPEILILDEPFSGLDPINQGLFKDALDDARRQGRTILFSTHVMEQAEKLCDEICLISGGRSVLQGDLARIKRERGGNAWRLEAAGDLEKVARVHGVRHVQVEEGSALVLLEEGASGPAVLRELVGFLEVREFHSEEPDLETIFVEAVSGSPSEVRRDG